MHSLDLSWRRLLRSGLPPVDGFNTTAFMDVAEAVHQRLYSTYSPEKILASQITLRTPVQYSHRWSMRHNDVYVIWDRLCGNRGDTVFDLIWFVEAVLVGLVCESPVAEGGCVGGDVDR